MIASDAPRERYQRYARIAQLETRYDRATDADQFRYDYIARLRIISAAHEQITAGRDSGYCHRIVNRNDEIPWPSALPGCRGICCASYVTR